MRSIISREINPLRRDLRSRMLMGVSRLRISQTSVTAVGLNLPLAWRRSFSAMPALGMPETQTTTKSSTKPTPTDAINKLKDIALEEKASSEVKSAVDAAEKVAEKGTDAVKATADAGKAAAATGTDAATPAPEEKKKITIWEKVKHEANHYWNGTKLLGYEIKVSTKLALKLASGRELTRREDRQLRRTFSDVIRLVPFGMFVVIPFAELLLPVALKIFPNLLPSTYESSSSKEKKQKTLSAARLNLSEYIQKDLTKMNFTMPKLQSEAQQKDFEQFFKSVYNGERPSRDLILRVARMFKDDSILDNLERPQLVTLAKYMNMQPFGTNIMLRYSIRHRMRIIKQDDRIIEYEGTESLNTLELQNACQSRGFHTVGVSTGRMREDLKHWLQLRLHDRVPSTLLILGAAFSYGKHDIDSLYDGVLDVLSALPDEVYHEAKLEVHKDNATNAQRLEFIKEQQELIQDEQKEEEHSGQVIPVRDNLNVDDEPHSHEPGAPEPTVSEEASKADQGFYEDKPGPEPTPSEGDAKADESYYKQKPKPQPTESEEDAKADEAFYTEKPKPQPTESEADAKADEAFYDTTPKPEPTVSEQDAKADQSFDNQKPKPEPTTSEMDSKADERAFEKQK